MDSKLLTYSRYAMLPGLGIAFAAINMATRGSDLSTSFPYFLTDGGVFDVVIDNSRNRRVRFRVGA